MRTLYFIIIVVIGITKIVHSQTYEIEGRVVNSETKEPIPYSTIYNMSLNKGTLSNVDGYFRVSVKSLSDSVRVTFTGYNNHFIKLETDKYFYPVKLKENVLLFEEVTITPEDNSYLYNLVNICRKSNSKLEKKSKAYYELKSFVNNKQIELVEGYYNVGVKGYKLKKIHLKAGRVALQPYENRFFASLESSRAIAMLDLFKQNEYFPKNPLELNKWKLKKSYYLKLKSKYIDESNDSIYIIDYKPKDTSGLYFEGELWLNKTNKNIVKINLICADAHNHPFLPLFPSDEILKVSFNITQSFKDIENDDAIFNHTDFVYKIDYKSRIGKAEDQNYSVNTSAVLYSYDYSNSFFQPIFNFSNEDIGDYRKINATPYNDFFWTYNDEYSLNDSLNSNESFFSDTNTLTNKNLFTSNEFSNRGLLEHPYFKWSKTRVKFREILSDTISQRNSSGLIIDQYDLVVKIYVDINSYKDSTNILTSTIFDPYESYYYLPMDSKTHCFVNLYFDLCEIERRKLEESLRAEKNNIHRIHEIYNNFLKEFEEKKYSYFRDTQHGKNESEMQKYNAIVFEQLGIDNISLFEPYKSEK